MNALKILAISISIYSLCFAASVIIPSDLLAEEPVKSKLDCKWKYDKNKKQVECYGKDCERCTGKKAMGGRFIIKFTVCTEECFVVCSAWINEECVEWEIRCVEICRGRR